MNIFKTSSSVKSWKPMSLAGFGLSGIGLVCAALIIGQLMPPILDGRTPDVSIMEMAIEMTVAILFLMAGFSMMVIGADPFEDLSSELPSEELVND